MKGKVYLIGAGPGDPGLITVRGRRLLALADVVVYDHLVGEDILGHGAPRARFVYAGKEGGSHTLSQEEINRLLVEEAGKGKVVVRLKGGDPFIFGRGGEEAEVLAAAGIPFEIVPGVTSAIAVPAYAGIPLTHRGLTSTVAFVTGHEDPLKGESAVDWAALARLGTLVFLMGVKNLRSICECLMENGRAPETPCALIRRGTTADQRTLEAPLSAMAERAREEGFTPPAVLVVGEVCGLRGSLDWFEKKPLFGRGIVVTRPAHQAGPLADLLAEGGARVLTFPTVEIQPPPSWEALDTALGELASFDWVVFTSANGVRFFFHRLYEGGGDVRDLKGLKIAAIGPATARSLEERGLRVDLVPKEYVSEGVVAAFGRLDMAGKKVLLPRAAEARDVIPLGLENLGARVEVVSVYRTVTAPSRREVLEGWLSEGLVDMITFTSPSTVRGLCEIMGGEFRLPPGVEAAVIGPVTAAAARRAGIEIAVLKETYTIEGLVEAITRHYAAETALDRPARGR